MSIIVPKKLDITVRTNVPGYEMIRYQGTMSIPEASGPVQFNPLVKLQPEIINLIPEQQRKRRFLDKKLFDQMLASFKQTPASSLEEATANGYVDENIRLTLGYLFPPNASLTIADTTYSVNQMKWTYGNWQIDADQNVLSRLPPSAAKGVNFAPLPSNAPTISEPIPSATPTGPTPTGPTPTGPTPIGAVLPPGTSSFSSPTGASSTGAAVSGSPPNIISLPMNVLQGIAQDAAKAIGRKVKVYESTIHYINELMQFNKDIWAELKSDILSSDDPNLTNLKPFLNNDNTLLTKLTYGLLISAMDSLPPNVNELNAQDITDVLNDEESTIGKILKPFLQKEKDALSLSFKEIKSIVQSVQQTLNKQISVTDSTIYFVQEQMKFSQENWDTLKYIIRSANEDNSFHLQNVLNNDKQLLSSLIYKLFYTSMTNIPSLQRTITIEDIVNVLESDTDIGNLLNNVVNFEDQRDITLSLAEVQHIAQVVESLYPNPPEIPSFSIKFLQETMVFTIERWALLKSIVGSDSSSYPTLKESITDDKALLFEVVFMTLRSAIESTLKSANQIIQIETINNVLNDKTGIIGGLLNRVMTYKSNADISLTLKEVEVLARQAERAYGKPVRIPESIVDYVQWFMSLPQSDWDLLKDIIRKLPDSSDNSELKGILNANTNNGDKDKALLGILVGTLFFLALKKVQVNQNILTIKEVKNVIENEDNIVGKLLKEVFNAKAATATTGNKTQETRGVLGSIWNKITNLLKLNKKGGARNRNKGSMVTPSVPHVSSASIRSAATPLKNIVTAEQVFSGRALFPDPDEIKNFLKEEFTNTLKNSSFVYKNDVKVNDNNKSGLLSYIHSLIESFVSKGFDHDLLKKFNYSTEIISKNKNKFGIKSSKNDQAQSIEDLWKTILKTKASSTVPEGMQLPPVNPKETFIEKLEGQIKNNEDFSNDDRVNLYGLLLLFKKINLDDKGSPQQEKIKSKFITILSKLLKNNKWCKLRSDAFFQNGNKLCSKGTKEAWDLINEIEFIYTNWKQDFKSEIGTYLSNAKSEAFQNLRLQSYENIKIEIISNLLQVDVANAFNIFMETFLYDESDERYKVVEKLYFQTIDEIKYYTTAYALKNKSMREQDFLEKIMKSDEAFNIQTVADPMMYRPEINEPLPHFIEEIRNVYTDLLPKKLKQEAEETAKQILMKAIESVKNELQGNPDDSQSDYVNNAYDLITNLKSTYKQLVTQLVNRDYTDGTIKTLKSDILSLAAQKIPNKLEDHEWENFSKNIQVQLGLAAAEEQKPSLFGDFFGAIDNFMNPGLSTDEKSDAQASNSTAPSKSEEASNSEEASSSESSANNSDDIPSGESVAQTDSRADESSNIYNMFAQNPSIPETGESSLNPPQQQQQIRNAGPQQQIRNTGPLQPPQNTNAVPEQQQNINTGPLQPPQNRNAGLPSNTNFYGNDGDDDDDDDGGDDGRGPGRSGDFGRGPGRSGDLGRRDDPGRSGDFGRRDDPGRSGDFGRREDPGRSDDPGRRGGPDGGPPEGEPDGAPVIAPKKDKQPVNKYSPPDLSDAASYSIYIDLTLNKKPIIPAGPYGNVNQGYYGAEVSNARCKEVSNALWKSIADLTGVEAFNPAPTMVRRANEYDPYMLSAIANAKAKAKQNNLYPKYPAEYYAVPPNPYYYEQPIQKLKNKNISKNTYPMNGYMYPLPRPNQYNPFQGPVYPVPTRRPMTIRRGGARVDRKPQVLKTKKCLQQMSIKQTRRFKKKQMKKHRKTARRRESNE